MGELRTTLYYNISSTFFLVAFIFFSCCLTTIKVTGQTYGLKFQSHDVLKDQRTALDLNPKNFLNVGRNFELSFHFSLNEYNNMYFGYIVRIIDSDNKNLDLIYNFQSPANNGFEVVYGENLTNLSIPTNFTRLCRDWNELSLSFDNNKHELTFSTPDTSVIMSDIHLSERVKILFGASEHNQFKTNDVPPMNIKDIRISQVGSIMHEWPLNEEAGNHAGKTGSSTRAEVINPEWLRPKFNDWQKILEFNIEGNAEVVYNSANQLIFFIGEKKLLIYSVIDQRLDSIAYNDSLSVLRAGGQAFYDSSRNLLVMYNLDLKTISTFNLNTRQWNQNLSDYYPLTVYWHHNKFYSEMDSTLYVFGGYGQHEYKNTINRFTFSNWRWDTIQPYGDSYYPRYLAALGYYRDSIIILGGYGSISGKQIINPQNFYDLWLYSIKENRFEKLYNFEPPNEDIAFSNSLIINPDTREFWALAFPNFKYDSYLQLYQGTLDEPGLNAVGNQIPYLFHDIISYSDLFYSEPAKKLLAVTTLFNENNYTAVTGYSIGFPPNKSSTVVTSESEGKYVVIIIIGLTLLTLTGFVYFRKRKKKVVNIPIAPNQPVKDNYFKSDSPQPDVKILFFGGFQIINKKGVDITTKFSPLVKELFLLIWLYSIKDKGISTERLIEILWFDKDVKSAKNNLAVNIAKIKKINKELEYVHLSRPNKYWKFSFDKKMVFNDYWQCITLINSIKTDSSNLSQVIQLLDVANKGHFLENSSYSWLDEFKGYISNLIIDTLIFYSNQNDIKSNYGLIIQLADTVLHFDEMNEEAVKLKCKALTIQGKHSLAKELFQHFSNIYKSIYNENYNKTFTELVN